MVFFHSAPVDVFDSNIWILGITERHSGASGLIKSALDGDRSVVVSPYIYDEVFAAFDRDLDSSHAIDAAKDNFSNIVFNIPGQVCWRDVLDESKTARKQREQYDKGALFRRGTKAVFFRQGCYGLRGQLDCEYLIKRHLM